LVWKGKMKIDIELLRKERKQWRENSLLQTKSILRLSQELDNLRKQKEILHEKLLKSATQD
jgi:molecular chaperone GrpE (heat shock protein)